MSRFTKEEQTEIVRVAMNLEAAIQTEKSQLAVLSDEEYDKPKPQPPKLKTINQKVQAVRPEYPKAPRTDYSFDAFLKEDKSFLGKLFSKIPLVAKIIVSVVMFFIASSCVYNEKVLVKILGLIFLAVPIIVIVYHIKSLVRFNSKRNQMNSELAKNPEYVAAREKAEKDAKEKEIAMAEELKAKQESLNREYEEETKHYEAVTLPEYNKALAKFNSTRDCKISIVTEDLQENLKAQEELYNSTMLIPKNNRSLNDLVWMYDDMSTSEHDFERALDVLNANKQLALSSQIQNQIQVMTNEMTDSMFEIYSAIERGNDISEMMSKKIGKVRRDMNIGNIVGAKQRNEINEKITALHETIKK